MAIALYTSSNESVATVATDGTVTLLANGTTTITAHTDGDATHDAGDAKYTLKVLEGINGLEGLYADGVITTTEKEYMLTLTDAVVTYNNGKNTYLQDANRGMMIFSTTDKPTVGKKISGEVVVKAIAYSGLYELTAFDASAATLTDASAAELQPAVATIADILASPKSYESKYIKIVDATVKSAFTSKSSVIYQNDAETNTITMRDGNSTATLTSRVGDIVTVTGFPAVFTNNKGTTQQFTVWSQDDIVSAIKYFKYSAESFEAKIGVANTFPKLTNDYDETPTYSSSNPAVATINEAGEVTLVAPGTTTITATLASAGETASYELTVSELQSYAYTRVNDASEIVDGGKYILVAEPITVDDVETVLALTAPTGTNKYFASLAVPSDVYYYGPSDVAGEPYELTLESTGTDGRFFVKYNDVYLQGSSSSSDVTFKDAKPETTNTNAIWAVEINDAQCDLTCVGANRVLGVNKSTDDKRFALYKSDFTNLAVAHLYRRYNKTGEGSVTIATTEGFGTLYSDKAVVIPEGLTATTVKAAADGQLTMDWEYAAGNTVPAGTGLLVKGENGTTYDFITTDNAVALSTANLLSGSATDATTTGAADSKFYKLTYSEVNGEQVLGFFWGAENGTAFTNEAGKAYLVIPAGSAANGFRLDGSAITGINNVALDRAADKIYTISGVAVSAQQGKLPAGLYIVNGQKQIVK
ncbi:MAG: Ig-like domain-containing protein [Prevotellamassilia sp.]|nr:Ig-like domain-containing protein [Prevotellamassilia sp.]